MRFRVLVSAAALVMTAESAGFAQIRYPIDGFVWYSLPDWGAVGDCFGNCGGGCSDEWNPCGGRYQYWELEVLSEPQPIGGEWWDTECWSGTLMLVHLVPHQAWGRWTYYGHAATGCFVHDALCPEFLGPLGCSWWLGCGSEWDEEWVYEELVQGAKRADVEPVGSCYVDWWP